MKHDEPTKFCAYALWLAGYGASTIGRWLLIRRAQALGVCQRSPWGARDRMTIEERQKALYELKAIRFGLDGLPMDGGRLNRFDWQAMPLEKSQVRG